MNYAMIPINRRYNDNDERVVRRVLISYKKCTDGIYQGTKIIEKDPYFYDKNASHQYLFTDTSYSCISDAYGWDAENVEHPYEYDAGRLYEKAIEFEADSDEEAIKMFNNRSEIH